MSSNEWSKTWDSSKQPSKQRKYRRNAPQHVKDKLVSANLSEAIREELETRSLNLNVGDRVEVMRGDDSGQEGIISRIDRQNLKVYVNNIENEKNDGTKREKALDPSNLQITAINLENMSRIEKYDVDDAEAIEVDEEELEKIEEDEEGEMMKQMQGGDAEDLDEDLEEELEDSEETEEEDSEEDTESEQGSDEETEEASEESDEEDSEEAESEESEEKEEEGDK